MIRHALTAPIAALLTMMLAAVASAPARAQASPPFVESAPAVESVPQYLRQLAGRDLDDLLLADGIAAQSGWVGGKYAFYLAYRGPERMPDWLALSLANTAEQKAPLRVADVVANLLAVSGRAAFLRNYDDRLAAAGPWRLCLARAGHQVLIHNRGSATFVSFAQRELSADITCTQLGG
jgi:hypothetical protein